MEKIIIDIIIPLLTAILGFFGGCHFEKKVIKQKVSGDNKGIISGGNIKNVYINEKNQSKNKR